MDLITSLLNNTVESTSKIVTVMNKVGNTSYSVVDRKNRYYIVESAESYLNGQSVVIKNGIILGRIKSVQTYKEFNV